MIPPELTLFTAAGLVVLCFFTSALTAVASVGGGIALISVMATFLTPATILPVHGVVQLGSNLSRVWIMRHYVNKPIVALFTMGAVVGVALATSVFVSLSTSTLQLLLGTFILFSIWTPSLRPSRMPEKGFLLVGTMTGFCGMFVGAVGPFLAAFLPVETLKRHAVVATAAACMSTQHLLRIVAFGFLGFAYLPWSFVILAMIMSGVLGTWAGTRVLNRIPERSFLIVFKVVITALALRLLWAALSAN